MNPAATRECARCGITGKTVMLPTGPICSRCRRNIAYHPGVCPECSQLRPIAYPSTSSHGVLVCASCAGTASVFACTRCGREDHPYGADRCARCILTQRLTVLLTDPATGSIHDTLQPIYDELAAAGRPQSVISWLQRPPATGTGLLGLMARGEMPITHDAFRALPADRSHNYLRELLTSVGVLPPYQPAIERMLPWLDAKLTELTAENASVINRFARWHILRRLRRTADAGTLTNGSINVARTQINAAIRLCNWATERGRSVTAMTQADLERYVINRPGGQHTLHGFVAWLRRTGLNTAVRIAAHETTLPEVILTDADRWAHVDILLHDDRIRLYARIGGLFMLLFAQPLTAISRMRTDQVTLGEDGRVTVSFTDTPVQMPGGLDDLIRTHLTRPATPSITSQNHGWLFPGRSPGGHLVTENFRAQLVAHGIRPGRSRHIALFGLAAAIPAPVLADLIGIADKTATKWAALAARDWSAYIAQRNG
ncbi:MAG: hypothetical protein ACR2HR_11040 [Euzebya sp.]